MSELKAYAKPPALVELCLQGVMTALKKPPTWDEAKKQLGDANFLLKLLEFDKDQLVDALLSKIKKFTDLPEFSAESVGKVSGAARGLCQWVHAMYTYGSVAKVGLGCNSRGAPRVVYHACVLSDLLSA